MSPIKWIVADDDPMIDEIRYETDTRRRQEAIGDPANSARAGKS
jgi:hypothetical protein